MINIKRKLKNFGPLEILVISSFLYVFIMLVWTASTRSQVLQKASDIKSNHNIVVEFINNEDDNIKYLIISFTSDWLFPTRENKEIVETLNSLSRNVSFLEIDTDKGHDSFLLDEPDLDIAMKGFLESNYGKTNE